MKNISVLLLLIISSIAVAQDKKIVASVWDGVIVLGYVDGGAFVNFGGPSLKFVQKPFIITAGVLPSLRIKEDNSGAATRNSLVMPTLGAGITFTYKHLAFQIPVYYNNRTSTTNGRWNSGLGIGYKF